MFGDANSPTYLRLLAPPPKVTLTLPYLYEIGIAGCSSFIKSFSIDACLSLGSEILKISISILFYVSIGHLIKINPPTPITPLYLPSCNQPVDLSRSGYSSSFHWFISCFVCVPLRFFRPGSPRNSESSSIDDESLQVVPVPLSWMEEPILFYRATSFTGFQLCVRSF